MRRLVALLLLLWASCAEAQLPWNSPPREASYSTVDLANPVNWTSPLNRGLVAWWLELPQLNEGGVTWRELARGNHGTLTNMATPATATSGRGRTTRPGGFGELRFDGTNDFVVSAQNLPGLAGDYAASLSVWVKYSTIPSGTYNALVAFTNAGTSEGLALFTSANVGVGALVLGIYSGRQCATATGLVTTGIWYHLAGTKSPGGLSTATAKLYLNGVAQALTCNSSGIPNFSSGKGYVGGDSANEYTKAAMMDDARIAARVYGATEVVALVQEGRTSYPTTLNRLALMAKPGTAVATPTHRFFQFFNRLQPANDDARTYSRAVGE